MVVEILKRRLKHGLSFKENNVGLEGLVDADLCGDLDS
jgi:hypothetical protein